MKNIFALLAIILFHSVIKGQVPQLVKDINTFSTSSSSPTQTVTVGNLVFFTATDPLLGIELWKTDGTEAGTALVKDILVGLGSSLPANLANVNGTLFFSATNGTQGVELWKSDGTEAGTTQVLDINAGATGSISGAAFLLM